MEARRAFAQFATEIHAEQCSSSTFAATPAALLAGRFAACRVPLSPAVLRCLRAISAAGPQGSTAGHTAFYLLLHEHLTTHALDPENELVGMAVAPDVAKELARGRSTRTTVRADDITLDVLLARLSAWADTASDAQLASDVRAFAERLPPCLTRFPKGSLVVLDRASMSGSAAGSASALSALGDPGMVYARVVEAYEPRERHSTGKLRVTCDPSERQALLVPLEHVVRLPHSVAEALAEEGGTPSPRTADRFVWDPYCAALEHATRTVEDIVLQNVCSDSACPSENKEELAKLLNTPQQQQQQQQPHIADYPVLKHANTVLGAIRRDTTATEAIESACSARLGPVIAPFKRAVAQRQVRSRLSSAEAAHVLQAVEVVPLVLSTIGRLACAAEELSQAVENAREAVLSGARKAELSRWYLGLIHDRVDELLASRGFQPDAVPDDYTVRAPASLEAVRQNQRVCHDVLAHKNAPDVQQLLRGVCSEVYPRLDAFVADAIQALVQVLQLPVPCAEADPLALVEAAKPQIRAREAAGDKEARKLANLAGDIEYVCEMHRREKAGRAENKDVVPVSGLVLGRVARAENEMKTVIEIWELKSAPITRSTSLVDTHSPASSSPVTPHQQSQNDLLHQTAPPASRRAGFFHRSKKDPRYASP